MKEIFSVITPVALVTAAAVLASVGFTGWHYFLVTLVIYWLLKPASTIK